MHPNSMRMSLKLLCILFCFEFSIVEIKTERKPEINKLYFGTIMGSYSLDIIAVEKCDLPETAYHPTANVTYHVQPYRNSRKTQKLRANFTVVESFKDMGGSLEAKYWGYNSYTTTYNINNMSCHHILMEALTKIMKLSVSPRCTVAAGFYSFDNLDYNILAHLIVSVFRYGQYSLEMNWISSQGVIACIRTIVVAKPDKRY